MFKIAGFLVIGGDIQAFGKIIKPSRPLRSGGLLYEIFVVVNTEECGAKQQELGYEQQDRVINVACRWQQQSHCREDYRHHP